MEKIMSQLKSIKNNLHDVLLAKKSFVPEGQSDPISYYQLVLQVMINDEEHEVTIKLNELQNTVLSATQAPKQTQGNFLDDQEK
jgi:hypothetical protein